MPRSSPRRAAAPKTAMEPEVPCAQRRRAHPTFMMTAEPPTWGAERDRQTYRERIAAWCAQSVGDGNALPYGIYVFLVLKMAAHLGVFWHFVRDASVGLYDEQNFLRFLVYNILGDALGLNAASGPLAMRLKYGFVTWYNMLRPGTLTCPLVPGVKCVRRGWQCAAYAAYLGALVAALRSERLGPAQLGPCAALLALLSAFDLVTFFASRGEHFGYMLVCCLLPHRRAAVLGCQLVQIALWTWAGVAKCGPWMKYVNAFMMPNSLVLRATNALGVLPYKALFVDHPSDLRPSSLLRHLATLGILLEVSIGTLCALAPELGVPLATLFHMYILSMTPFASVNEWNVFCIYAAHYLFAANAFAPAAALAELAAAPPIHAALLAAFLALVLLALPCYGQLRPKRVPFLAAYRPYAGNWRMVWHVVRSSARHKLDRLPTLEGMSTEENAKALWPDNPHFGEQIDECAPRIPTCRRRRRRRHLQPSVRARPPPPHPPTPPPSRQMLRRA